MIITVKELITKKNKYEVVFSNNDSILANEELVLRYRLVKGKELEEAILDEIKSDAISMEFYDKALNYLSKGLKSTKRIKDYLKEKKASENDINKVITLLNERKLLNDEIYFKSLTSHYIRQGYGVLYIKQKAFEQGINREICNNVLNEYNDEDYLEYAKLLKNKKVNSLKHEPDLKDIIKVKKYLYNRGYDQAIIEKAFKE